MYFEVMLSEVNKLEKCRRICLTKEKRIDILSRIDEGVNYERCS